LWGCRKKNVGVRKKLSWVNCVLQKALKEIYTWGANRKKKTKHNRKRKIDPTGPKEKKTKTLSNNSISLSCDIFLMLHAH